MSKDLIIKEKLTTEFLETLLFVAKHYGWSGDYVEIYRFLEWVFDIAGIKAPDLNPL